MNLTPELQKVLIDGFIDQCLSPDHTVRSMEDPNVAKYRCSWVSEKYSDYLKEKGIECSILDVCGMRTPPDNNTAYPQDYAWRGFGHVVVVVGELWIDWTARQMDSKCAFPYIADARTELKNWRHLDKVR